MRRSRRFAHLLAVGLLLGGEVHQVSGQDTGPPLTLGDLYRQIEVRSPRLTAARASARAATHRLGPGGALPDPQVQLGLMNRSLPSLALQDPLGMNQIQVMQMIPFPGKLGASDRSAEARAEASSGTR